MPFKLATIVHIRIAVCFLSFKNVKHWLKCDKKCQKLTKITLKKMSKIDEKSQKLTKIDLKNLKNWRKISGLVYTSGFAVN